MRWRGCHVVKVWNGGGGVVGCGRRRFGREDEVGCGCTVVAQTERFLDFMGCMVSLRLSNKTLLRKP